MTWVAGGAERRLEAPGMAESRVAVRDLTGYGTYQQYGGGGVDDRRKVNKMQRFHPQGRLPLAREADPV